MRMTMREYQKLAQRTSPDDGHDKLDNGVLGLMGETGEIVDIYKKWMYQSEVNTELPGDQMAEELGDVLWYLAELAAGIGVGLIDIIGEDFAQIDERTKRKPAKRTSLRSAIVGLAGRAWQINRCICKSEWRGTHSHIRRIMLTITHLAHKVDLTIEEVAIMNINKLKKRYPYGFSARRSMERYE